MQTQHFWFLHKRESPVLRASRAFSLAGFPRAVDPGSPSVWGAVSLAANASMLFILLARQVSYWGTRWASWQESRRLSETEPCLLSVGPLSKANNQPQFKLILKYIRVFPLFSPSSYHYSIPTVEPGAELCLPEDCLYFTPLLCKRSWWKIVTICWVLKMYSEMDTSWSKQGSCPQSYVRPQT